MEEKKSLLPTQVTISEATDPRDFVIVGIPKIGKGTILGALTREKNAIVLDLEKGGYEYIDARKVSSYELDTDSEYDSFKNYIKWRNALLAEKGRYDYLIIDGLSDLDALSVIGGTLTYMNSTIGKKFNRAGNVSAGEKLKYGHKDWKPVTSLPDGAGL